MADNKKYLWKAYGAAFLGLGVGLGGYAPPLFGIYGQRNYDAVYSYRRYCQFSVWIFFGVFSGY